MNNQPVILSGALYALGNALIALVVIMGWFPMTPEQVAAWNAVLAALIAVGTWWVNNRTVATSTLQSYDGKPVTGASVRGGQAVIAKDKAK